jgi:hypothetical protein
MLGSYCDSWKVSFKIHIIRTVIHLFIQNRCDFSYEVSNNFLKNVITYALPGKI